MSSGNSTLTSGNFILGTYSLTQTILNSLITNYASYATQTWVYNQGYLSSVDVANFLNKNGDTMAGTLNFSTSFALGNIYSHAQICLYNVDSNLNWYGFSMDTDKLVYNVNSSKTHSFQHGGVELIKINSTGLYIGSSLL